MEFLETSDFALAIFDAKFTRMVEILSMGSAYSKTREATQHFENGLELCWVGSVAAVGLLAGA